MNLSWLPQVIGVLIPPIISGCFALWLSRRTKPAPKSRQHPPLLNGYATMIQQLVERAEWLRTECEALRVHNAELQAQLDACEKRRGGGGGSGEMPTPIKPPARRRTNRR